MSAILFAAFIILALTAVILFFNANGGMELLRKKKKPLQVTAVNTEPEEERKRDVFSEMEPENAVKIPDKEIPEPPPDKKIILKDVSANAETEQEDPPTGLLDTPAEQENRFVITRKITVHHGH